MYGRLCGTSLLITANVPDRTSLCSTWQHLILFSTDSGPFIFLPTVVDAGNEVKVDGVAYGTKGRRRGRQQPSTTFTPVAAAFFFEVTFRHRRIQIGLETLLDRFPVHPLVLF